MIKVRFLTVSAGAGGVIRPGDIVEVSESEARLLVNRGYAVEVEPAVKEPKPEPEKKDPKPEPKSTPKAAKKKTPKES